MGYYLALLEEKGVGSRKRLYRGTVCDLYHKVLQGLATDRHSLPPWRNVLQDGYNDAA